MRLCFFELLSLCCACLHCVVRPPPLGLQGAVTSHLAVEVGHFHLFVFQLLRCGSSSKVVSLWDQLTHRRHISHEVAPPYLGGRGGGVGAVGGGRGGVGGGGRGG